MRVPKKPGWVSWNHNIHYHDTLLGEMPQRCQRALDVGCGTGGFAVRMAARSDQVVGLDSDAGTLDVARQHSAHPQVSYVRGDLLTAPLADHQFDFVSCIAAVHHMDLAPALWRLQELLAPGGVLAVLGFYRNATLTDFAHLAAVTPIDVAVGLGRARHNPEVGPLPAAPIAPWSMSLDEIRSTAADVVPGSLVRRRMYFRYTLSYRRATPSTSGQPTPRESSTLAASGPSRG